MLFILLLLAVGVVLAASIMFSDDSRMFLLKSTSAAILSIIPGWVYLQFLRNKGPSLYDEFVLNLFRLKIDAIANLPAPPQHTDWYPQWLKQHSAVVRPEVKDNLYRRKFEAVYGPSSVSTADLVRPGDKLTLRERTETFGPVVMATIVIALAWALVLQPELLRNINILGADFRLSGRPLLPADLLRFTFLGAYAFILLDLSRRYFRDDLKSAAYISFTTRIVFASALVIAADAAGIARVIDGSQINAVAFFIGFFPKAGFTWLRAMLPSRFQAALPQLESDYPLRNLEGLNIWYESRLIEEGIESMQNLCTASLVDVMLKTRLPIMRVVDWIDQAYLYLHLPKSKKQQQPPAVQRLRLLGIRTATDLERVWALPQRAEISAALASALVPEKPEDVEAIVTALIVSLDGEPNLWHVRAFRELQWLREQPQPGEVSGVRTKVAEDAGGPTPAGGDAVDPMPTEVSTAPGDATATTTVVEDTIAAAEPTVIFDNSEGHATRRRVTRQEVAKAVGHRRKNSGFTVKDLQVESGGSEATVRNVLNDLLAAGKIREVTPQRNGRRASRRKQYART